MPQLLVCLLVALVLTAVQWWWVRPAATPVSPLVARPVSVSPPAPPPWSGTIDREALVVSPGAHAMAYWHLGASRPMFFHFATTGTPCDEGGKR